MSIPNIGLQHAGKYLCVVAHSPFQSNRNRLEVTLSVYSEYRYLIFRSVGHGSVGFLSFLILSILVYQDEKVAGVYHMIATSQWRGQLSVRGGSFFDQRG